MLIGFDTSKFLGRAVVLLSASLQVYPELAEGHTCTAGTEMSNPPHFSIVIIFPQFAPPRRGRVL